jgi:hypothetical protein
VSVPPLGNLFLRRRNFSISVRDFMSKVKDIPARLLSTVVAIFLIAAVPLCAQAQKPSATPLSRRPPRGSVAQAVLDAEVVWIGTDGLADFDALHSRVNDRSAVAVAFDLMSLDGEDFRYEP